jgi:hypothetical protein
MRAATLTSISIVTVEWHQEQTAIGPFWVAVVFFGSISATAASRVADKALAFALQDLAAKLLEQA